MAKDPPFNVDPHVAVRDPESLPAIVVSAMYDLLDRRHLSGSPAERFINAFNVAVWSLTTAGRKKTKHGGWTNEGREARLKKGTLELTPLIGKRKNREAKQNPEYDKKHLAIAKLAKQIFDSRPDYYSKTWQEAHSG